jgi:very-short-patch-repair endonuclease
MTRCYEFYCIVLKNPEFCDKSDSTISRITQYIEFMQKQGIQFDKSPTDKARFIQLQVQAGATEKAITQPSSIVQEESNDSVPLITETPKIQPLNIDKSVEKCSVCETEPLVFRECELCHLATSSAIEVEGHFYCNEEHAERAKATRPSKPQPKLEVKEWKPKETWEQRKAVMKPQHSRIEEALLLKLYEKGLTPITDKEFCIQSTTPDFYFPDKNLAIYVDGAVHEGKEDRDNQLRDLLEQRHHVRVVSIPYKDFTQEETERVFQQILGEC